MTQVLLKTSVQTITTSNCVLNTKRKQIEPAQSAIRKGPELELDSYNTMSDKATNNEPNAPSGMVTKDKTVTLNSKALSKG